MINILIVDKEIKYATKLSNYILYKNPHIRIFTLFNHMNENLDMILNQKIDLIILDYTFLEASDSFLHKLKSKSTTLLVLYPNTNYSPLISSAFLSYPILYTYKSYSFDKLYNKIFSLSHHTKQYIRQDIINELTYLGYNLKHLGSNYLLEAIIYIYNSNQDFLLDNLEKNIYSLLATKHKTTISNVKSNILKATNYMYVESDYSILKDYFCFKTDVRPTPKLIICQILNRLYSKKQLQ